MQYVKDDMDELFKRAAESYPLKTEAGSWDDIAPAIVSTSFPGVKTISKKQRNASLFLLLFIFSALLIPFIRISAPYTDESFVDKNNVNTSKEELYKKEKPNYTVTPKTGTTQKVSVGVTLKIEKNITSVKPFKKDKLASIFYESLTYPGKGSSSLPITKTKEENLSAHSEIITNKTDEEAIAKRSDAYLIPESENKNYERKDTGLTITQAPGKFSTEQSSKQLQKINKKRIYVGVFLGPQLTEVKSQGFGKTSLSIGLLAGYRITQKLSTETGIFYSKKHYQSDGKYFDMAKAGPNMPPNMEVISVEGSSSVFEIPLTLKYDFKIRNKSDWFVRAGLSSYLLTNEQNNYRALVNGTEQKVRGVYENKKAYLLSAIRLSGGHEFRISKNSYIRIEPYIEIPIRGVGIGYMQLLTTGLHIGLRN